MKEELNEIEKSIFDCPTISILGNKGKGKTYGSAILINKIPQDNNVLVFDTLGAYTNDNLLNDSQTGYIKIKRNKAYNESDIKKIISYYSDDINILCLDLSELINNELVDFMNVTSKALISLKVAGKNTLYFVVDEIGEYTPQDRGQYSQEFERLVRIGRNFKIKDWLITQRPQKVNKNVLALSDVYISLGLYHNLDLEALKNLIGQDNKEFESLKTDIKGFDIGECVVIKGNTTNKARFDIKRGLIKVTNSRINGVLKSGSND